jgi:hypothetical protein
MTGGDRARHCARCRLTVYNLSEMTANEALAFVRDAEGRTCVRFYRRADGTVLTRDCSALRPAPPTRTQRALMAAALAGALAASTAAVDAVRTAAADLRGSGDAPVVWDDAIQGELVWEDPAPIPPPPPPPAPPPPPPPGW